MYEYRATVVNVVDADTVDVVVDLGFHISVKERLRLYGINAPEVRGATRKAGLASTQWLKERLDACDYQVIVRTEKDKKGKYGRYLATLIDSQCRINLNELMVTEGHAVEFMKR